MADIIRYDTNTGLVLEHRRSVNTPDFEGRADILINPVLPSGVAVSDLKVVAGLVVELTPAEKLARNTAATTAAVASFKANAKDFVNARPDEQAVVIRAIIKIILSEINLIRTNAALGLAPRTATQIRNAIEAEIDA